MNLQSKITILLVEDSSPLRRTISDILRVAGFQNIVNAEDGRMGLKKLEETDKVDIIILDWDMPVMNGLEMLKAVRASDAHRDIPVLMLTAHASEEDVINAVQFGATNYIVKPFTPDTLYKKIGKILGSEIVF